jgi:hypothetical protein
MDRSERADQLRAGPFDARVPSDEYQLIGVSIESVLRPRMSFTMLIPRFPCAALLRDSVAAPPAQVIHNTIHGA